jgi:hypothetical protein
MIRHTSIFVSGPLRYYVAMNVDATSATVESVRTESISPNGLGDMVAAATSAVGVKPCSACKRRQAWLNRLGHAAGVVVTIGLEPVRELLARIGSRLSLPGRSAERRTP